MAATRLIPLHINKGKTIARCLAERTDYSQNGEKTSGGEYVTSYACDPETADQEFLLSKRQYEHITGRHQSRDIIAYQIRQSFKPGEVTPELANKIESTIGNEENEAETFNAFDSLRTLVSNIPIRYVVDNVIVSTLDDSTTTIPYSVVLTPVQTPYMGVDNWGKYLYNSFITLMGPISSPWYAQMFGAPDDVTGYDDAVAYVKQVESQIAAYSVHKSAGTEFKAWVERASSAKAGITAYSSGETDGSFRIETDNETAAYDEDGKLTFTGNAVLEVTALSGKDGVLYIQDDEGNVKTIVIDVVEPHTCHSDTWRVELAPSEEYDGYRAKCCDICGDTIAVETLSICSEHNYGDWIIEREATEDSMGIRYHECQNCYARETEYLPIVTEIFDMQLLQYGENITVAVNGTALVNEQTVDIKAGSTFTVASEFDCIVAYSTDSGATFNRLEGDRVSEEESCGEMRQEMEKLMFMISLKYWIIWKIQN